MRPEHEYCKRFDVKPIELQQMIIKPIFSYLGNLHITTV